MNRDTMPTAKKTNWKRIKEKRDAKNLLLSEEEPYPFVILRFFLFIQKYKKKGAWKKRRRFFCKDIIYPNKALFLRDRNYEDSVFYEMFKYNNDDDDVDDDDDDDES